MSKILVVHGPNLNLLGDCETQHYGQDSLDAINTRPVDLGRKAGHTVEALQSNAVAPLIRRHHAAQRDETAYIIINPARVTHTAVALRHALAAARSPFTAVRLSNVHAREPFRRHSYFSDLAAGVITGLGPQVYELALDAS